MGDGWTTRRQLPSPTGALLTLHSRRADGRPIGVVQINHGLAEHSRRYGRFAAALSAAGFHVYAHDHRGHGTTTAADAPPRLFATTGGTAKVIADIGAVHDVIAGEAGGLPVILFGHSMGGLIGVSVVQKYAPRLAGAAIWNASFTAGPSGRAALAILAWERMRLGSDVPSRLLPRLTFRAWARQIREPRTAFDWLSRDAAEVDAYIADPLCGWDASVSLWRDLFAFIFAGVDDARFAAVRRDFPFNLVGGAADPATSGGRAVKAFAARFTRMGFSNVNSKIYPETRHESLNDVNRNIITDDFIVWARAVTDAARRQ